MLDKKNVLLKRRNFIVSIVGAGVTLTLGSRAMALASNNSSDAGTAANKDGGADLLGQSDRVGSLDEVVFGKPVVSLLDVNNLEPGKVHRLYFRGVETPSGQPWLVSVTVAKGARSGKRVTLVSGVHGDEMSSINTVQTIMNELNPAEMQGTVMAVFDVSRPAIEAMTRRWPNSGRGEDLIDINRLWPGDENAASAPARHAWLLFNRLIRPNSDYVLDFHTGTTGIDVPAFHLAKMDVPEVREMAELFPVAQIFDNVGYPGLLSYALLEVGIPSFTPEVGNARSLDRSKISLFVEGTMNVLKLHGIIKGPIGRTSQNSGTFVGNSAFPVMATSGGLVEHLVNLGDPVVSGQKIAIKRNMFGEIVAEYTSPVNGEIGGLRSDATSEPDNVLVFILFNETRPQSRESYPE